MSKLIIKPSPHDRVELGKRTRLPVVVISTCPACGESVEMDLSDEYYLSYPVTNEPIKLGFYHTCSGSTEPHKCTEWSHNVILRMTLEEAT